MQEPKHVYIGSYSNNIQAPSLYDLRPKELTAFKLQAKFNNPSFILCQNKLIYLIEEHNNGSLITVNQDYEIVKSISTQGNDPVHISINPTSTYLSVTNYSSGSIIIYKLINHVPDTISHFVMHQGKSLNNQRQQSPHPHCSIFSRDGNTLFVADLGTDYVYYYQFGGQTLEHIKNKSLKMLGSGPRHIALGSEEQKVLYVTCELDSTIRVLSYANQKLELMRAYRVSQNPMNYLSQVVYRNQMLYLACRGDNCLIIFEQKKGDKASALVEKFRFKIGQWPRHFKISNAGTIYIACQNQNAVQRFKWDNQKIFQLGTLKISNPSCIAFQQ